MSLKTKNATKWKWKFSQSFKKGKSAPKKTNSPLTVSAGYHPGILMTLGPTI